MESGQTMARASGKVATSTLGKRGTLVIPAEIRRRYGLKEGSVVLVEERSEGILLRPAVAVPVERYDLERKAEFLLNNAVGRKDYAAARKEVRRLGHVPDKIAHKPPAGK